jgi:hypothetical protein
MSTAPYRDPESQESFRSGGGGLLLLIILVALALIFLSVMAAGGQEPSSPPPLPIFKDLPQQLPAQDIFNQLSTPPSLITTASPSTPTSAFPVTLSVRSVHDADTFTNVTIHLPLNINLHDCDIRAYGYDACEVNRVRNSSATDQWPITDDEIKRGLQARDDLISMLLLPGKQGYVENRLYMEDARMYGAKRDPYGRISGYMWIHLENNTWINLANYMNAKSFTRERFHEPRMLNFNEERGYKSRTRNQ